MTGQPSGLNSQAMAQPNLAIQNRPSNTGKRGVLQARQKKPSLVVD